MLKRSLLFILLFSLSASVQGSLEDILAPLPEPVLVVAKVSETTEETAVKTVIEEDIIPITSADLKEALEAEVTELMRPNSPLTLVPLRQFPDLTKHSKPFVIRIISAPSRLSRSNILLRFQVENVKGPVGEFAVPFRAHLYNDVFFMKTNLKAGDIASASDFEVRRADLLVESSAIPANVDLLERHEYSRNLNSGRVLEWGDLVERSVVRKGEMVEVFARNGLLAITTRAIARQDGAEGDYIVLRNLDSNKEFSGLVVSENQVQVKF